MCSRSMSAHIDLQQISWSHGLEAPMWFVWDVEVLSPGPPLHVCSCLLSFCRRSALAAMRISSPCIASQHLHVSLHRDMSHRPCGLPPHGRPTSGRHHTPGSILQPLQSCWQTWAAAEALLPRAGQVAGPELQQIVHQYVHAKAASHHLRS